MRFKLIVSGVTLLPALLLAGCGADSISGDVSPDMSSPAISGRSFGGQQPIAGATIYVIEMGTAGYGSTGTILAQTTTDGLGNFQFAPGAYTCPQSNTPVYLLGVGGNSGSGINTSAVTAAGLGSCANAKNTYTILNEVTTTALAFALSHFFTTTLGGTDATMADGDWFGGPSSTNSSGTMQYSRGLVMANSVTIPSMINSTTGSPLQNVGWTVDANKIYAIANSIADCINSNGSTASNRPCGKLFADTTPPATTSNPTPTAPSDTLQAAVQMALYPAQNVAKIYTLGTSTPPFNSGLTAAPNDWTIGISFTSSSVGLAVDAGTVSTLDIDGSGNIWFPSNKSGAAGVAYFDPTSRTFNGPYNSTSATHPQQVAIDANGYIWLNDSASTTVAGYLTTSPTTTESFSFPLTFSNSVTIGADDRVNVGTTKGSTYSLANISADRSSYSAEPSVIFTFPVASMAGDTLDGDAVTISDPSTATMRSYYVSSVPVATRVVNGNDDSGQVIYTGNDYISVRSYSGAGNANDGLCIYSLATCYNFKGAPDEGTIGIAIDGASNLWVASSGNAAVLNVPINSPGATGGAVYLSAGGNNIPANTYLHGPNQGGNSTGTATTPYGIGVDFAGNVWVSNAGCVATDCTPGSFTLTEIVGAAAPTITPVSAQITSGTNLVGTEPTY
jgi:hypothetical protein